MLKVKLKNPFLTVRVTQADLETAREIRKADQETRPAVCDSCPVAVATTRALRAKLRRHPNAFARVGHSQIILNDGRRPDGKIERLVTTYIRLPEQVQQLVYAFDDEARGQAQIPRLPKEGIEFEIDILGGSRFPLPQQGQVWVRELRGRPGAAWEAVKNGEVVVTSFKPATSGFVRVRGLADTRFTGGWYPERFQEGGSGPLSRTDNGYPRERFRFTGKVVKQ